MENLQKLYESSNSTIFKGKHKDFKNEILIKVLKTDAPAEAQLTRFENEYKLTHNIKIQNVRKALKIAQFTGKNALFLEYFDGKTLKKIHSLKKEELKNKNLLSIAINIAQTLGEIHEQNIIHKDLTSNNILVNKYEQITIIDFGLSIKYNFKAHEQTNTTELQGTLSYIAPEQTGRINRGIDFRSDLYSLGIILYELFTQKLPFQHEDSMKLIHAHIAKKPTPPVEVEPLIPKILSDIILKLLSKNPEERYQSAFGLKHDLEKIENEKLNIENFELGENDYSGKLTIPEKTYGQNVQIEQIQQSYDRVGSGSAELLNVSGKSGVGKSAVVHEIIPTVIEKNGIFIEGRFDEFQKDIPFYAFQQAFEQFVRIILNETEEKIIYWTKLIKKAVGELGKILTDILPDLELIIGKQPEVPELEGIESRNRFNYLWTNFIKNISKSEHPIVLFFKNIQYADNASMELLKILLTDKVINYFLCITSFNPSKITQNEQFNTFQQDIEKENTRISNVEIKNLAQKTLNNFLSDILNLTGLKNLSGLENLTTLIYSKTSGNPFFVKEFLKKIYEEELLKFDYQKKQWTWQHKEIEKYNISDNVVKLLTNKIKQLSLQTKEVLNIAACYGNIFDLKTISDILQKNIKETKKELEPAITEGIITLKDKNSCQFVHTQLLQAVYSLVSETERKQYHYQIGTILLKSQLEHNQKNEQLFDNYYQNIENIFEIINQLNYSIDLINDRKLIANLNYFASKRAKSTVAFDTAYKYIEIASNLLPDHCWETDYLITLKIYNEYTELAYLTGKYKKTEELANFVIKNAKDIIDTTDVYAFLAYSYTSQIKYKQSISTGLKILKKLGFDLPKNPKKLHQVKEFIKTKLAIGKKTAKDFENLPKMTDRKQLAIAKIINAIGTAVYLGSPDLFPIMLFKSIRVFIKYGNCTYSPYIYVGYGIVMAFMNKFDKAIEFGALAKNLTIPLDAHRDSAKINHLLYALISIWKTDFHILNPLILNTYQIGVENGDLEYASFGLMNNTQHIYCNLSIQQIKDNTLDKIETLKKLKQEYAIQRTTNFIQLIDNLIIKKDEPCNLKGDYFNEDIDIPRAKENNVNSILSIHYANKLFLHIIFNDLTNTKQYLLELEELKDANKGSYFFAINNFYRSIIYLRHFEKEGDNTYLKKTDKNQKTMKMWAKHCPENFQHKYDLIEAEKYRILKKIELAKKYYDKAISGATKYEFWSDEAICWEFAAIFYFQQNTIALAKTYIQNSFNCYKRWGAIAKCDQLENKYPQYISIKQDAQASITNSITKQTNATSTITTTASFDLSSIIQAGQSLAGEVKLDNLLKNMLKIIMENAGAEYVVIIINNNGKFEIQGKGSHSEANIQVMQSENIAQSEAIPLRIINFVIRTGKFLILDNAIEDKIYSKEPYIQKNKAKSVFCHPVKHKDKIVAVLYLENDLSTNVFSAKRIETINILSSQIAISIENAFLYENLEEKVKIRTNELSTANSKLQLVFKQVTKQKDELQVVHKNITDSINYASKIQNAILPTSVLFKEFFADYFIFFKPRDVVSGDFYYIKKINKYLIVAAADCTGHGVPGAFVSMLGISFLNEIIRKQEIKKANEVLDELRVYVKNAFHQSENNENTQKDGMDISLIVINTETNMLQFAGANNPLYIINNEESEELRVKSEEPVAKSQKPEAKSQLPTANIAELKVIKPDKQPIGIYIKERPFTNHEVQLQKNDRIYLFTDGYLDQFGGEDGRKFYAKRFKKLLLENIETSMSEQNIILGHTFKEWRGHHNQLDDILIIGLTI